MDVARPFQLVRMVRHGGRLYVVYSGSAMPPDAGFEPGHWYAHPYPTEIPCVVAGPFATPEQAERSIPGD